MEVTMPEKQKGNPALQRQLEHLLDWNGPDFERKLPVRDSTSPEYLASEILVMALRRPWSADDAELAERIATELLDRWGKYILSAAYKRFRVTAVEMADSHRNQGFLGAPSSTNNWLLSGKRGDMIQEVHLRLWRELKDPAKQQWEKYFHSALTFLCKDAYAQVADWQPIDDSPAAHENDRVYEPIDPSSEIEIPVLQGASLGMALASLPPKEATAVYLRHILGWPIGGTGGETKMTISVAMGVSTKMVGNYLHDAKEHLLEFCEKELQS